MLRIFLSLTALLTNKRRGRHRTSVPELDGVRMPISRDMACGAGAKRSLPKRLDM
jgi:hypothetical protein